MYASWYMLDLKECGYFLGETLNGFFFQLEFIYRLTSEIGNVSNDTYLTRVVATPSQRICWAIVRIIIWLCESTDNPMTYRSRLTKSFATIKVAWHAIKSIHSWQIGHFITNEPNTCIHAHGWQIFEIYEYWHESVILVNLHDALQGRHNERDCDSSHRRIDCLFSRLSRRRSKKTAMLRFTDFLWGNPPATGGFPSQRACNSENASIWWCRHATELCSFLPKILASFYR